MNTVKVVVWKGGEEIETVSLPSEDGVTVVYKGKTYNVEPEHCGYDPYIQTKNPIKTHCPECKLDSSLPYYKED